jgi:hypothetical protein
MFFFRSGCRQGAPLAQFGTVDATAADAIEKPTMVQTKIKTTYSSQLSIWFSISSYQIKVQIDKDGDFVSYDSVTPDRHK